MSHRLLFQREGIAICRASLTGKKQEGQKGAEDNATF